MSCDKCGTEPPPGTSYQLTARGKLCPACAAPAAVRFSARCAACQNTIDPANIRTRLSPALDGRVLCGYCRPFADAAVERKAHRGRERRRWRR